MAVILPPVVGVGRTTLQWAYGTDSNVATTLHWQMGSPVWTQADATTVAGAVMAAWVANLLAWQPSGATLQSVTALSLNTLAEQPGVAAASHVGTLSGYTLPADTCVLVNHKIARRYRGGRPRNYLPLGISTHLADPQHWDSVHLADYQSAWNAFVTACTSGGTGAAAMEHLVNVSYYQAKVLRPTPVVDSVLASVVNPIPGSQRRRMGR